MNINKAILHVFDFTSCVNVFAQTEMDLGNKVAKRYVTSQAKRAVGNLDSKRGTFAMIMLVDVSSCSMDFTAFAEKMKQKGDELGVDVRCTRQEIYDAMHRI